MILNDKKITEMARNGMIKPFYDSQIRERYNTKIISIGVSSYGYDVQLSPKVQIFTNANSVVIDPKAMDQSCLINALIRTDNNGQFVILPPNSYMLGHTVEHIKMPDDVTAVCVGKSTYARCGAIVNVTPIEAGWEGEIVIEIANSTPLPMKIYVNEGIAQLLFFRGEPCAVTYADRKGKYQGQTGITLPKV